MCARITMITSAEELAEIFGLEPQQGPALPVRFNIAPSQSIHVVTETVGKRELVAMKWGLVPHWNQNEKPTGFINARSETAGTKPAFRDSLRHRRCLIPANGFYEWKTIGKRRQPTFFRHKGGGLMAFAGLWDSWQSVPTVAILTTSANELVRPLHDRMPVILNREDFAAWLNPKSYGINELLPLLKTYPHEMTESWLVSPKVNSAKIEDYDLSDPIPIAEEATKQRQPTFEIYWEDAASS